MVLRHYLHTIHTLKYLISMTECLYLSEFFSVYNLYAIFQLSLTIIKEKNPTYKVKIYRASQLQYSREHLDLLHSMVGRDSIQSIHGKPKQSMSK